MKYIRLSVGGLLVVTGILLTIIPGSTLIVIAGLLLLSYDWPRARGWLQFCQSSMSGGARKLDRVLLARKLRRRH